MNPIVVLVLAFVVLIVVVILFSNHSDKTRRRNRLSAQRDYPSAPKPAPVPVTPSAYDPLDGNPLSPDSVDVVIKTSKGDVKMRVNRRNAKTLNVRGLTAFPYFRTTFAEPSVNDRRYYMCFGDTVLDLIDHLLFYEFFFAGDDCVIYSDEGGELTWDDMVTDEVPEETVTEDVPSDPELSVVPEPEPAIEDAARRGGSFGYGDDSGSSHDSGGYDGGGDSDGGDCGGSD